MPPRQGDAAYGGPLASLQGRLKCVDAQGICAKRIAAVLCLTGSSRSLLGLLLIKLLNTLKSIIIIIILIYHHSMTCRPMLDPIFSRQCRVEKENLPSSISK